jgi:hypothetical protein
MVLPANHLDRFDDDHITFTIHLEVADFEGSEDRTHGYLFCRRNVSR